MDTTVQDALTGELATAAAELGEHLEVLRAATRVANQLGALASRVQGAAQDAEFDTPPAALQQPLQDLLQRTGFANTRSGEMARRLRDLVQGVQDLRGDVERVLALLAPAVPGAEG